MADDTKHDLTKHAPSTAAPSNLTIKKPKRDPGSDIDAFVQRSRALQAAKSRLWFSSATRWRKKSMSLP